MIVRLALHACLMGYVMTHCPLTIFQGILQIKMYFAPAKYLIVNQELGNGKNVILLALAASQVVELEPPVAKAGWANTHQLVRQPVVGMIREKTISLTIVQVIVDQVNAVIVPVIK